MDGCGIWLTKTWDCEQSAGGGGRGASDSMPTAPEPGSPHIKYLAARASGPLLPSACVTLHWGALQRVHFLAGSAAL